MKVYLFQARFAPMVANGTKRTTIRPRRKHPTQVGDQLSLREWTGKPYRSKHRILREGEVCKEVHAFRISIGPNMGGGIRFVFIVDNYPIHNRARNELAQADGFTDDIDMLRWFMEEHDVEHGSFEGELIAW